MTEQSSVQANSAQVAQALEGLDYPRQKREIVDYAIRHTVTHSPDVIRVIERIPDREYGSMADVEKSIGEIEQVVIK